MTKQTILNKAGKSFTGGGISMCLNWFGDQKAFRFTSSEDDLQAFTFTLQACE